MLTTELNQQIEEAKVKPADKFAARVTVAALDSLKEVAAATGKPIEDIAPADVVAVMCPREEVAPVCDEVEHGDRTGNGEGAEVN